MSVKLIECTTIPATRFNFGLQPHLAILSEVFKTGGIEMDNIPLSRSTLHWKKFKYVEHEVDFEWISITSHLKGRRLIVHFDTKLLEHITTGLNTILKTERLAEPVNSPVLWLKWRNSSSTSRIHRRTRALNMFFDTKAYVMLLADIQSYVSDSIHRSSLNNLSSHDELRTNIKWEVFSHPPIKYF